MCFGIGVTLARLVPREELTVIPAPSAFALACARLGWPLAEVETLTLHGRPLELLNAYVQPNARLLVLSDGAHTPAAVAQALAARGYGQSRLTVLEHMGGGKERAIEGTAAGWDANGIADFNTLALPGPARRDLPARRPAHQARGPGGDAVGPDAGARTAPLGRGRGLRLGGHRVDARPPHLPGHGGGAEA